MTRLIFLTFLFMLVCGVPPLDAKGAEELALVPTEAIMLLGDKALGEEVRALDYILFDLFVDAREKLVRRHAECGLAGECHPQRRLTLPPFITGNARAIAGSEKKRQVVL